MTRLRESGSGGPPPTTGEPLRFAVVSDTHVSTVRTGSAERLTQVYGAIAQLAPDVVLHCGDITDTGLSAEYDLYRQLLPAALEGRVRHVPGNHDVRWDATAKGRYYAQFGVAPSSFAAGGVHFVGLDPTQALQEPGHYGASSLRWLERVLRRLPEGTPVLLFQHFPVGDGHYEIDDHAALLDLVAGYDVRGIFAGHIHREEVTRFNELTQVTLAPVLGGPVFYWAEKASAPDGAPVLAVSRVTVAADGAQATLPVATVPLSRCGPRARHRVIIGFASGGRLPVTVLAEPADQVRRVSASTYPQVLAGGDWHDLDAGPGGPGAGRWSGTTPVPRMVPGAYRLQLRLRAPDGSWQEKHIPFSVPGAAADPVLAWRLRLTGAVQAGIAVAGPAAGPVAVAASTAGEVAAVRVPSGPGHGRTPWLWRVRLGPIYGRPGVDAAARTLFVPSADRHLYALEAVTGRTIWRFDAGAPVLSAPTVARAGHDEYVVFSAGRQLLAVHAATGQLAWSVTGRGFSAGQAACDGLRVYTSAADGYARAHDVFTGRQAWSCAMVSGDPHRVALYSGWDTTAVLGAEAVVVATVSGSLALEAATGAVRWRFPGSTMYPPAVVLGDGTALLTDEQGTICRVSLADGRVLWRAALKVRVLNAGVTVDGDSAWVLSARGRLIGVRLADGRRQGSVQHTLTHSFSRPVIVGGTLVAGDQDGFVHGIRLP
jgi:outer membrane protein assembly factor BamB/3',5'-cyclic AMP phosphodiesterase CpdA